MSDLVALLTGSRSCAVALTGIVHASAADRFTNELEPKGQYAAGLLAAAFIGIAPGTFLSAPHLKSGFD